MDKTAKPAPKPAVKPQDKTVPYLDRQARAGRIYGTR